MQRPISGYHQDDVGDWVVELSCGHGQHVRHKPPFTLHPWVVSAEERAVSSARCSTACAAIGWSFRKASSPTSARQSFSSATIPAGLRSQHSTKPGVWGLIHVVSGQLRYCLDGLDGRELILAPSQPGPIPPSLCITSCPTVKCSSSSSLSPRHP